MQEGKKKEGDKIMAAKSYKMNSACFVKLNVYGEAEPCNGEQRLVSNSNGTEERAAASTTSVPSPNLKLVPEPDWMGAQGEAEGGRLINAKIEILGSTDLYSGGVGLARFSSPLLSAGVRTGMPRTSSYFSPAPPCDCEASKRERML